MSNRLSPPADPHEAQARLAALLVPPEAVGMHCSPDVVRTLARLFPEVSVCWHVGLQRWWLVQTTREGRRVPFRMLGTPTTFEEPTIENTVVFVSRLAAVRTERDRQRWLDEIDATGGNAELEKDARERIREGAKELLPRLFRNRVMVTRDLGAGLVPGMPTPAMAVEQMRRDRAAFERSLARHRRKRRR